MSKDDWTTYIATCALFGLLIWAVIRLGNHTDDNRDRLDRIENRLRLLEEK